MIVLSVTAGNPVWLSLTFMVFLFFTDFGDKLITVRRDFASFRAYLNLRSILTSVIFDKVFNHFLIQRCLTCLGLLFIKAVFEVFGLSNNSALIFYCLVIDIRRYYYTVKKTTNFISLII